MPQWRISRSRLAAIYLRALRNEIEIDIDGYKAVGAAPEQFGSLPRMSVIWPRLKRRRLASSLALRLLRILWKRGLYAPFFVSQYFSLVRTLANTEFSEMEPTLHVLLSALAPQSVAKADGTAALAFTVPWQPYPNGVPHGHQISIGNALTSRELLVCLIDAIAIARRIGKRNTLFAVWHLQTYTLFRWICVARALERIECTNIVTANHYDRWAILIDRLGGALTRHTEIVQHGIEATRRLPIKLRFTDAIHVFNRQEEIQFRTFILSSSIADKVKVHLLDNSIELSEAIANDGRLIVVIVGHPEHEANQLRFLKAARLARPDVHFIYKPHPTARSVSPDIRAGALLWDQQGVFPHCDFVFSYQSTLAYQYRDAGISTYIHEIDISDEQVIEAVNLIPSKYTRNNANEANA